MGSGEGQDLQSQTQRHKDTTLPREKHPSAPAPFPFLGFRDFFYIGTPNSKLKEEHLSGAESQILSHLAPEGHNKWPLRK